MLPRFERRFENRFGQLPRIPELFSPHFQLLLIRKDPAAGVEQAAEVVVVGRVVEELEAEGQVAAGLGAEGAVEQVEVVEPVEERAGVEVARGEQVEERAEGRGVAGPAAVERAAAECRSIRVSTTPRMASPGRSCRLFRLLLPQISRFLPL